MRPGMVLLRIDGINVSSVRSGDVVAMLRERHGRNKTVVFGAPPALLVPTGPAGSTTDSERAYEEVYLLPSSPQVRPRGEGAHR